MVDEEQSVTRSAAAARSAAQAERRDDGAGRRQFEDSQGCGNLARLGSRVGSDETMQRTIA
ncbi:hypothetical protein [Streptomyces sp. MMBL 11-3]|uniref:hypothetical protein n=1 Tax=Streptomyces sp. MMBL 11-3 TaxID=3382639 RepID=UPI0039B44319